MHIGPENSKILEQDFQWCCCHCGSTQRLQAIKEAYSVCTTCLTAHERKAVQKPKVPKKQETIVYISKA